MRVRLQSLWFAGPNVGFAAGPRTIVRYDGKGWKAVRDPLDGQGNITYTAIWGSGSKDVFVVGLHDDGPSTVIEHYNGTRWEREAVDGVLFPRGVWGAGPNEVFVVGSCLLKTGLNVMRYDGKEWSNMLCPGPLRGIWGASRDNVFAVGEKGSIVRFDGRTWTPMESGTDVDLNGIWGSGPKDVLVVGDGGTILHYDGVRWSPMASGTKKRLSAVWGAGPQDVFAVGEGGTFLYHGSSGTQATRRKRKPDAH
ncbi:WD40/YVTN/BNR-like repeat-containing protein [Planctomycetota bacterium]